MTADKNWLTRPQFSVEFAAAAIDRFDAEQKRLVDSKLHDRIQRTWRHVYARASDGSCDTTLIGATGRKGETLLLQPNRFGRIIRNHVTTVQQTKSNPEPWAANTDAASQRQTVLARGIIEHYRREHDLEGLKGDRVFVSEICGDSYVHVYWDPDAGRERLASPTGMSDAAEEAAEGMGDNAVEDAAEGEEVAEGATDNASEDQAEGESSQSIVYEGDYRFSVRTPYEIARDRTSPNPKKPRWMIVKEPANKWDLLAAVEQEPDEQVRERMKRAIKSADSWTKSLERLQYDTDGLASDKHDDTIGVYHAAVRLGAVRSSSTRARNRSSMARLASRASPYSA